MQDLFGQDVSIYKGQPLDVATKFTSIEADKVLDDVVYDGLLLKQTGETLAKLKKLRNSQSIGLVRREAWEEFMWIFELWHSPAYIPFDTACAIEGADAEKLRCSISHMFADEISLMFDTVVAKQPEERTRLISKLRHYIDLTQRMH